MKGPGLRLLIDVRRSWKCPRCGYEEHVGAQVTSVVCPCCPGVSMKLVEVRKAYADQLRHLRERPKLGPDTENTATGANGDEEKPEGTGVADSSPLTPTPTTPDSESQQPARRRGKRPHKQPRRGRQKQQSHDTPPPADSEE